MKIIRIYLKADMQRMLCRFWCACLLLEFLVLLSPGRLTTQRCHLVSRGLSTDEQSAILEEHNCLRQRVACGDERGHPPAAAMAQLRWDEDLAERAQRMADSCYMGSTGGDFGKNVLGVWRAEFHNNISDGFWKQAVDRWFSQGKHVEPRDLWQFHTNPATCYYTQLVWASSSDLGCGFSVFPNSGGFAKLFICFYRPPGNIVGEPVYVPGRPCSACSPNIPCSKQFPALCCTQSNFPEEEARNETIKNQPRNEDFKS